MFQVKDFMTRDVITAERDAKISEVLDLMRFNHIHRIPVVDADDRLVGLITEGMIAGQDNSATSLSIYELNYLLSKTEVRTVMVRHVHSINQQDLMEEAADRMLKYDVGCLPVVDDSDRVVGIVTQNDVFRAFLDILGWNRQGLRLSIEVTDEVGALEKIARIFADAGVNIYNVSVYSLKDGRASMIIRSAADPQGALVPALEAAGIKVLRQSEEQ